MTRTREGVGLGPMKILSAEFELSAPSHADGPRLPLPEFAFIGRSNVGKSSLINLLAERHGLARVSDLPGKTRLLNFFVINRRWRLVDLPGYGYAHGAKTERFDFNRAVADYLEQRESLQHTYVLIDPRIEPQPIDVAFIEWLAGAGVPFSLVFTKADKQSPTQTKNAVARFQRDGLAPLGLQPRLFLTSSKTKAGRKEILQDIAERLAEA